MDMNKKDKSLANSMQDTLEYGNLKFIEDIGEICIDSVLDDSVLKDIPIIGTIVGVGKCIKNVYDACFAKKLITFLVPLKEIDSCERKAAIEKWEADKNYRGKVGETLLGMINRCDDSLKARWLSVLFKELVLKRDDSRMFMRSEKVLASLSVMDILAFLNMPKEHYYRISVTNYEPYIGSGLYKNPHVNEPIDGNLDLDDLYCEITEVGFWIYNILNGITVEQTHTRPIF